MKLINVIVFVASLAVAGCDQTELSGPPELRLGRDECAACGMLIDDAKSSSALLVDRAGHREHLIFDDIGCMVDYQREERADVKILGEFVHDYATVQWHDGASASFVIADPEKLHTPMASGIVACSDEVTAQRIGAVSAGRVILRGELDAARIDAKKVRRQFPVATQPG